MLEFIWGLLNVAFVFALYFLPAIVAHRRLTRNRYSVAVVNLLTGWTGIGWVVALAMAASNTLDEPEMRKLARPAL